MLSELPRPAIFAHRGASAHAPENTLAAFELAIRQKADAIELDAKLSTDGQVVVIHDPTVDRTTDGHGWVGKMTLEALRELDAGTYFDVAFHGECIPTLEEVFETVGRETFINIELTNYVSPGDGLPQIVAGLVKHRHLETRVLFSSFNPQALIRAKRILPDVPIGLLASPGWSGCWTRSWLGRILVPYDALHPERQDVTPRLVRAAHQRNQRVHTYTVNDPQEMRRLFDLGIDGVFTDDPALARQVLDTAPSLTR
jgi:glycerophosphoryl diester phosphodiesterase